ncbi:MAG: hypothetical protein WCO60_01220 [Verrucomicrobiota bacterium]
MSSPLTSRGWLLVSLGLFGGVALGALLPDSATPSSHSASDSLTELRDRNGGVSAESQTGSVHKAGDAPVLFPGARQGEQAVQLSPERVVALFDRLSNLKSDSRKYALAYRLAAQLGREQIESALKSAKEDADGGDYVALRALARRWAELDPQSAALKGLELKQQNLLVPVLESWARMDPSAPLKWALEAEPSTRLEAVRSLLANRILDQGQVEQLVAKAAASDSTEMRQQILPFATMRLAESNPQGALAAAAKVEDPQSRQRTLSMVLGRLSQSAPEVGRNWINSQTDLTQEQRQQYERILSRGSGRPPR